MEELAHRLVESVRGVKEGLVGMRSPRMASVAIGDDSPEAAGEAEHLRGCALIAMSLLEELRHRGQGHLGDGLWFIFTVENGAAHGWDSRRSGRTSDEFQGKDKAIAMPAPWKVGNKHLRGGN